jgi:transcription antitermination factor NusG
VPDEQVAALRQLVMHDLKYDPCPLLREGALVEIVAGPLTGIRGKLLRKDVARASVILSVDTIGQAVRVEVSASDLVGA